MSEVQSIGNQLQSNPLTASISRAYNEVVLTPAIDTVEDFNQKLTNIGAQALGAPVLEPPQEGADFKFMRRNEAVYVLKMLANYLAVMGAKNRQAAREARVNERHSVIDAIFAQVEKIRQSATFSLIGGVVGGAFGIMGGAFQMYTSVKATTKTQADVYLMDARGRAANEILQSVGNTISGGMQYQATTAQAEERRFKADEEIHNWANSDESDYMSTMRDATQSTLHTVGEVVQSINGSIRNIASHI